MRQQKKHHTKKIGMPPGALVHVGEVRVKTPVISVMQYDATSITERTLAVEELSSLEIDARKNLWLNIHGVHDAALIKQVGDLFQLHPLVQEDILNTEQAPKIDLFERYIFLEVCSFAYDKATMSVSSEQISFVLGQHFLLTFQERPSGIFEPIRDRLRMQHAHVREMGLDYLAYSLLDSVVDRYFNVLEQVSEDSESLEDKLLSHPTSVELQDIHQLKRVSVELRRAVWPLREVINNLIRNESAFFQSATIPYLRDVYDHTINFIESLESIRDVLSSMMDIYMASASNRVNSEVRALTVVAMLFMPATLITGIFGMNFVEMPWLANKNGFIWAMGLMAGIALTMGLIFWRRQWLGNKI